MPVHCTLYMYKLSVPLVKIRNSHIQPHNTLCDGKPLRLTNEKYFSFCHFYEMNKQQKVHQYGYFTLKMIKRTLLINYYGLWKMRNTYTDQYPFCSDFFPEMMMMMKMLVILLLIIQFPWIKYQNKNLQHQL